MLTSSPIDSTTPVTSRNALIGLWQIGDDRLSFTGFFFFFFFFFYFVLFFIIIFFFSSPFIYFILFIFFFFRML